MMKRIILLALLGLTTLGAVAQTQGRGRPWRRGPLTAGDFGAMPFGVREASHLDCTILYSTAGVTEGRDTYRYCRTSAVMFPAASWLVEDSTAENELNYNQMLFDIAEVHRRRMQREAMMLGNKLQYGRLLNLTIEELERELTEMQQATDHGRDSAAVERVRRKNREWLNAHPAERPEFTPRLPWWSVDMVFGVAVPTGSIGSTWSASVGTTGIDLGFGWGRHGFYYHYCFGEARLIDTNASYHMGELLNQSRIDISYGYGFTLIDRPAWSLTPYVAFGMTEFDWYYGESYTLGVTGRYHWHRWHRITNAVKGKARCYTVSAMGNLYASYADLGDYKGVTVGLQIGFSLVSRRERVEW